MVPCTLLLIIGMLGMGMARRNILLTVMSLEVMLLSVSMMLLVFPTYLDDITGIIFILYILVVGAAETAMGLSLIIAYSRQYAHV